MNFNTSPIAFFPSRAAQIWRAWFAQRKICVICGDDILPFYIIDSGQAPAAGELYDANTDTKVADITLSPYLLDHTITVDGVSQHIWIYQGDTAGVFGYTTPGYYYLKIGSWYSDVFRIGALASEYTEISWQFFDDIITADGTPISKHIKYKQIFETPLWHPTYNVEEEGKTNNGIFFAMSQTTKKTSGFNAIVNESQLDCLNLTRMADNITIRACLNGTTKTLQTNQFEISSKWQSDDVASIECQFDLFSIIRKYQQTNVEPEPLPIPIPPPPPTNYYLKGKTQSGVSSIKLNINGTVQTISVANGEFTYGYDTPISTLRTSVDSGNSNPDTPLQNCDKITELDLSESDGFGTSTSVVLNSLTNCTTINFGACTFAAVTSIKKMFDSDKKLTAVNMPSATFANVTQGSLMFADCESLTIVSMPNALLKFGAYGMFTGCTNLASIDLRACTFEDETSTGVMFCKCKKIGQSTFRFDAATFASVTDCGKMFDNATIANSVTSFASLFPVWAAQPTNAQNMFNKAKVGSSFNLSALDTSACTNLSGFLSNVTGYFVISAIDMSAATDLSHCFDGTAFDVYWLPWLASQTFAAAEDVSYMFRNSIKNTTQAAAFTAATFANVTNATGMFERCNEQKEIDLSAATFASLTTATNMFANCTILETLDLSAATFASVTNVAGLFSGCSKLKTLTLPNSSTMPISFGLAQSSELSVSSFANISNWVADKTGLSQQTLTVNATAKNEWSSQHYAQYTIASARMISKNWEVQ